MANEKPPPEFMSALTTEHYMLQGTSGSATSEVIAGLILLVLGLYYEHRRLTPVVLSSNLRRC
jgi:hypothetical protein